MLLTPVWLYHHTWTATGLHMLRPMSTFIYLPLLACIYLICHSSQSGERTLSRNNYFNCQQISRPDFIMWQRRVNHESNMLSDLSVLWQRHDWSVSVSMSHMSVMCRYTSYQNRSLCIRQLKSSNLAHLKTLQRFDSLLLWCFVTIFTVSVYCNSQLFKH